MIGLLAKELESVRQWLIAARILLRLFESGDLIENEVKIFETKEHIKRLENWRETILKEQLEIDDRPGYAEEQPGSAR